MRFTVNLLTALATVSVVSGQALKLKRQDGSVGDSVGEAGDLPACSAECLELAFEKGIELGCKDASDIECFCSKDEVASGLRECAKSACTDQTSIDAVLHYVEELCEHEGAGTTATAEATADATPTAETTPAAETTPPVVSSQGFAPLITAGPGLLVAAGFAAMLV